MTTKEAIKILQEDGWSYPEPMKAQAIEMAIDCIKKQMPKKLIPNFDKDMMGWYRCPNCHSSHYCSFRPNYCDECGQALDWSDVSMPIWKPEEDE